MSTLNRLPSRPPARAVVFDLTPEIAEISAELACSDEANLAGQKMTRELFHINAKILTVIRFGGSDNLGDLLLQKDRSISSLLDSMASSSKREGVISRALELSAQSDLLQGFFSFGCILPPSSVPYCTDEEYIGACLNVAQDIARYCVARAREGDDDSVLLSRDLLDQFMKKMLEFDFRNGPLRRKFDGLKYALKLVEDLVFEGAMLAAEEVASKRLRRTEIVLVPVNEIDSIRIKMDDFDAKREDVIKRSRDLQKLSKQGIYSVQRGDIAEAELKLAASKRIAEELLSTIIQTQPALRYGAFSNALEEWAEGILLLHWAKYKSIARRQQVGLVDSTEYIGALSDFSGEIGRLGVAAAASRKQEEVDAVLAAATEVVNALVQLDVSNRFAKKTEAAIANLKKIEDISYDLYIMKKSGKSSAVSKEMPPQNQDNESIV